MIRRNFAARWKHLLWYSDLEATRFTLAMGAIMWGLLLSWDHIAELGVLVIIKAAYFLNANTEWILNASLHLNVSMATETGLFPTELEISQGRGRLTYAIMAKLAKEEVWAALWLLQGSVMLYSLFTGFRNCKLMIIDAMLGCALWTICVASSYVVYWPRGDFIAAVLTYKPPAAMAGEIWMIAASWWCLIRYTCESNADDRPSCQ